MNWITNLIASIIGALGPIARVVLQIFNKQEDNEREKLSKDTMSGRGRSARKRFTGLQRKTRNR